MNALADAFSHPPVPALLVLAGVIAVALGGNEVLFRWLRRTRQPWVRALSRAIVHHCWWSSRVAVSVTALDLAIPGVGRLGPLPLVLEHLLSLAMIISLAWLLTGISFAFQDVALLRFRVDVRDNLRARRIHTQVMVIRRLTVVVVSLLTLAIIISSFTDARVLGTSLLASAGIAGAVVGIAARPLIANF